MPFEGVPGQQPHFHGLTSPTGLNNVHICLTSDPSECPDELPRPLRRFKFLDRFKLHRTFVLRLSDGISTVLFPGVCRLPDTPRSQRLLGVTLCLTPPPRGTFSFVLVMNLPPRVDFWSASTMMSECVDLFRMVFEGLRAESSERHSTIIQNRPRNVSI